MAPADMYVPVLNARLRGDQADGGNYRKGRRLDQG
jgi:hypothetical protein